MGFDINHVVVSGNLTRDPELRHTGGGTAVCGLRIANNQRRKDGSGEWVDEPHYFDVTVWSGLGEWMANNLQKGSKVVCSGVLRWREWTDNNGNKRQSVDITAYDVVPVPKDGGGGRSSSGGDFAAREDASFTPRSDVPADTGSFTPAAAPASGPGQDDDIPF